MRTYKRLTALLLTMALVFSGITCTGCFSVSGLLEETKTEAVTDAQEDTTSDASATVEDTDADTEADTDTDVEETATVSENTLPTGLVREQMTKATSAQTVTVLMYVNGSNLESEDSEATTDLSEVIAAPYNENVNILVQTMGTKTWNSKLGVEADHTQRFRVVEDGLELVDDSLGQLDCTSASTLQDFITWGTTNYPADRYILQFWDHGGGPVYGFGYDEWNSDENAALTIDEMQSAIAGSGVKFDFIGMDCCIMSCLELCMALYEYCDYMILSEEFESGLGWSYEGWVTALSKNPSIATTDLAKIAIDDMVSANSSNSTDGDSSILALIDESSIPVLFTAWCDFAYENESTLLENNYSQKVTSKNGGRVLPRLLNREDDYSLSDYFISDIMAVAENISSDKSTALSSAVSNTLLYVNKTSDETALTGLSVTLPYGDSSFYSDLKTIFTNCGLSSEYVSWLENFTSAEGSSDYYDYDDWDDSWDGWDSYEDDYDWDDWDFSDDYDWDDWDDWDIFEDDYWDDWDDYGSDDGYDDYDDGYYEDDYYDDGYSDDGYYEDDYYDDGYSDDGYYEDDYYDDGYYEDGPDLGGYYDDGGEDW